MNRIHERNEGERRKQDVLRTLAARREIYVHRGRRVLLARLLSHGLATADDVRRAVELPDKFDPRCLGSVPGPLARAGIIRRVAYERSDRRERHASIITVWELLDADAARDWLARHPDLPDDLGPDAAGSPVAAPTNPNNGTGSAAVQSSLF
jgi:hypothetical protein